MWLTLPRATVLLQVVSSAGKVFGGFWVHGGVKHCFYWTLLYMQTTCSHWPLVGRKYEWEHSPKESLSSFLNVWFYLASWNRSYETRLIFILHPYLIDFTQVFCPAIVLPRLRTLSAIIIFRLCWFFLGFFFLYQTRKALQNSARVSACSMYWCSAVMVFFFFFFQYCTTRTPAPALNHSNEN